jgi:cytosine/uracil/thiamine/allantoin permease
VELSLAAFILEIALLIGGAALFLKSALHRGRLVGFVIVLVLVQWVGTFAFPPPTSDKAEALTALLFYFLFAAIAWWAGRDRPAALAQPAS